METFIVYILFASILGLIAKHKNRNWIAWGIFGGLFFIISVIILIFLPKIQIEDEMPKYTKKPMREKYKTTILLFTVIIVAFILLGLFFSQNDTNYLTNEDIAFDEVTEALREKTSKLLERNIAKEHTEVHNNATNNYISEKDGFSIEFPSLPQRTVFDNAIDMTIVNYRALSIDKKCVYNVFINYFNDKKVLSNEAQEAFLKNALTGRLAIVENGKIIKNRLGTFKGFSSSYFKYSHYHDEVKIITDGVVFLVDGDAFSLTCLYPENISPEYNFTDFINSFELSALEPKLKKTAWVDHELNIKITPPKEMFYVEPSQKGTVAIFANKAGHSLMVIDIKSIAPSIKISDIKKELLSAKHESDGFYSIELNNGSGVTFIQMAKIFEFNGRIYIIKSFSPKSTFIRYKEAFKASMNTFASFKND